MADVPADIPGGINRFMSHTSDALEKEGHRVDHLFRDELWPRAAHGGLRRLVTPWLVVWRALRRRRTYDLVEIHEPLAAAYCVMRRFLGLPPCAVLSYGLEARAWEAQIERWNRLGEPIPFKSRLLVPLTLLPQARYALRHAQQVLVPNDGDRDYAVARIGVPSERLARVNTGVADRFFQVSPRDSERVDIVFIGSWIDRKGTPEIARAWSRAHGDPGLGRLVLLGTGLSAQAILADFPEDVRNTVQVRVRVTDGDLIEELRACRAFVLPSWCEGMPLATLEAAAAGLACVVSAIPGHVEIFRPLDPEADGGLLVPPHDANSLEDAFTRLGENPDLVRRLGRNARARARSFTWRDSGMQILDAYEHATTPSNRSKIADAGVSVGK